MLEVIGEIWHDGEYGFHSIGFHWRETMFTRRNFLSSVGAGLVGAPLAFSANQKSTGRKKMAIVATEWRLRSHAQHMGDRFLVGYPMNGIWRQPKLDVVSLYVDQVPHNDLSRQRADEFGFKIYPSIDKALRLGGDTLAVDAVLVIGEHGDYERNELGQKKYPRYEFFKQVADVFRKDGKAVPVFNDKHLSWKWEWAKEMVDTAHALKFPLMAGSSLPVTWRMPIVEMPTNAETEEVMCLAMGGVDSYDFHALEVIQCMAERRQGGETGVKWVQAYRGDSAWKAMQAGSFDKGGFSFKLFDACMNRSQTLAMALPQIFGHRKPTADEIRNMVEDPVVYRFEYNDGLKATMLLMNGLVSDFTFAAKLKGIAKPLSTLFYLPPTPNVHYSAVLMSKVEEMFLTGKAVYPAERTLLTSGVLAAAMKSLSVNHKKLQTPHLSVRYHPSEESTFCRS
jgi:hypothetical protein